MSSKSVPKDAQVMAAILKDMGVTDYEPRIINAMLEFTYRYVTDVLDDAKVYSSHAYKKNIDVDDIKLAIQCRLDNSLTTPPPKDLLMDLARHKDSTPLPLIKPYTGLKLPPDRYCLSALNYRLKTLRKSRVQMQGGKTFVSTLGGGPRINIHQPAGSSLIRQSGSMTPGQSTLTLLTKGGSQPKVTIRSAPPSSVTPTNPLPIIKFTPGSTSSMGASLMSPAITSVIAGKRKREDEDYDNP